MSSKRWQSVAVVCCILAFALRVVDLGKQSLWWDEALSVLVARQPLSQLLSALEHYADFNPPLFYVIMRYWMLLAGQSEFAVRWLSVGAGVLAVAVAATLARRLFGPAGAALSALFFAIQPFLVYYGQEARGYTLTTLLSLLVIYWALRGWQTGWRPAWGAFVVAAVASVYNFYFSVLLLAAIPVALIGAGFTPDRAPPAASGPAKLRARLVQLMAAYSLVAIFCLPWLPIVIARQTFWQPDPMLTRLDPQDIIRISWPYIAAGLPASVAVTSPLLVAAQIAVGIAALVAVLLAFTRVRLASSLRYCLLTFLLTTIAIVTIAYLRPSFHPRYMLTGSAALYLAIAGLAAWRPAKSRFPLGLALALPAFVAALYGLYQLSNDARLTRDDYRSVVAYIAERERPGDIILSSTSRSTEDPALAYYYNGRGSIHALTLFPYREAEIASQLEQLTSDSLRVWYLRHEQRPTDPERLVVKQLAANGRLVANPRWNDLELFLFDLLPNREFAPTRFLPAAGNFGGLLALTGLALPTEPVAGGDKLDFSTRWQVLRPPGRNLGVWGELRDDSGVKWGREDRRPANERFKLGVGWVAGQEVMIRHSVPVLAGTPPGVYRLRVAVYDLDTLVELETYDVNGDPLGRDWDLAGVEVSPSFNEPDLADYQARPADASASGIRLLGASISPKALMSGDRLDIDTLWSSEVSQPATIAPSVRVTDEAGGLLAEQPIVAGYPPSRWSKGQYVRLKGEVSLPADAKPGRYKVVIPLADGRVVEVAAINLADFQRVFQPPKVATPTEAIIGGIAQLVGFEISSSEVRAGGKLSIRLVWKALTPTSTSFRVFIHLAGDDLRPKAQKDGEPQQWQRPTTGWQSGEYVEDRYEIPLPDEMPAGQYQILVGMYNPVTGQRLPAAGSGAAGDFIRLSRIEVK